MAKLLALEEVKKKIFGTHGVKVDILEYRKMSLRAKFKCNVCSNVWESNANSVCRGTGCPECKKEKLSKDRRHSIDSVKTLIEKEGCRLVSKAYINEHEKMEVEFQCGHIYEISLANFKAGKRCGKCRWERMAKAKQEATKIKVLKEVEDMGFEFISFESNWASWNSTITFRCNNNHAQTRKVRNLITKKNCSACTKIEFSLNQTGKLNKNWQGGLTPLSNFIRKYIVDWKKESMEACSYRCVISGERFHAIHHPYSLNLIIKESINNLSFELKNSVGEYAEKDLDILLQEVLRLHDVYGLGVCLHKSLHKKLHNLYGLNTTPEDFEEFKNLCLSEEINVDEILNNKKEQTKVKEND